MIIPIAAIQAALAFSAASPSDDPILQRAFARMDELRQELEKLNIFVSTYRTLANGTKLESANIIGTLGPSTARETPVDEVSQSDEREAIAPDAAPAKRVRVRDNPKPTAVVEAAVEVIRNSGRPLTRREIHRTLAERGVKVRGADPIKALGTML